MDAFRKGLNLLAAVLGLVLASESNAQTLYRCGNKYQDRPCDAGQAGKAISNSTGAPAAPAGGADADCARIGQDSNKVVWGWEGGATSAGQIDDVNRNTGLSESQKQAARKLVSDVYRQRGTANQVRARIESECMAEKEERARQKAIAEALIKSGARSDLPPAAGTAPAAAPVVQGQSGADAEAATRKRRCAELNSQLESIRTQQRSGGSAQAMDRLRESYNSTSRELSSNRCS